MNGYTEYPFDRREHIQNGYIIATYQIYDVAGENIYSKAGAFAVGQTIGTWLAVPGITEEMIERYQARVLGIYPVEISGERVFIVRIAFPYANMESCFAAMLTTLLGNDVSTALKTKLIDLEFFDDVLGNYTGPRKGIQDLRDILKVNDRPLVLNMIKPCAGFHAKEGAKLFYEVARGGIDLVKDDELLCSPGYNLVEERVKEYSKAEKAAYEHTGKHTIYIPNITDTPSKLLENAKAVLEAGAKACMVNFVFTGLDVLKELCDQYGDKLFILGHYAGVGIMNWKRGGISNALEIGLLPRLAGVHSIMTMYPLHNDIDVVLDFQNTVQLQRLGLGNVQPVVTAVGGGITPRNQEKIQQQLGKDIIIGIGGAVQGHPSGTLAGAEAVIAAVEATANGIKLCEAADNCQALKEALEIW